MLFNYFLHRWQARIKSHNKDSSACTFLTDDFLKRVLTGNIARARDGGIDDDDDDGQISVGVVI